jgi:GT2 family glycosyltransferase
MILIFFRECSFKSFYYFMKVRNSIIKWKHCTCFNWRTEMHASRTWKRQFSSTFWWTFKKRRTSFFSLICIWNFWMNTSKRWWKTNASHSWISNIYSNIMQDSQLLFESSLSEWSAFMTFESISSIRWLMRSITS